jgi:hypothetical protein
MIDYLLENIFFSSNGDKNVHAVFGFEPRSVIQDYRSADPDSKEIFYESTKLKIGAKTYYILHITSEIDCKPCIYW